MNQAEYNAKVQEIQAMWPPEATRIQIFHSRVQEITSSHFQVYWDGQWHTLGSQRNPFTYQATYEWHDVLELKLRGAFAGALIHS